MSTASLESLPKRTFRRVFSVIAGFFWYYSPFNKLRKMKFYSEKEVVDKVLDGYSVSRYGDMELRMISNTPTNCYQDNNVELAERLHKIAFSKDAKNIVCFPKPLCSLKGLNLNAKLFWISNAYWYRKWWKKCIDLNKTYGSTQITRPYIDYRDKSTAKDRYENLKRIWDNKKVCLIEGEMTHLGEGNDLFNNAKSIKRILAPSKNAFDVFDEILKKAEKIDKDYIFLIALGPTATILSYELSKRGRVAFDAGHIDVEYEWMLRGTKKKIAIAGKAVNEKGALHGKDNQCNQANKAP